MPHTPLRGCHTLALPVGVLYPHNPALLRDVNKMLLCVAQSNSQPSAQDRAPTLLRDVKKMVLCEA